MTHKPEVIKLPLSYYVDKLKYNSPFTFSRYGDGEWLTILGYTQYKNSNGCSFTSELGNSLRQTIKHKSDYQYALLKITRRKQGDKIARWLADNNISIHWYNGDLFLDLSLDGLIFDLIEQIRERRVLYIGNERLKHLRMNRAGFFPYVDYIVPPVQNAFENRERILNQVYSSIKKNKIDFIGWSSGLAAKYFIDQVYQHYPEITQLDFGSMFDGYFKPLAHIANRSRNNTGSRSYIRSGNYDFAELLQMNTKGV